MNDNIDRPEPDSQFRLRPCTCGSEDVVYQSYDGPAGMIYRVKCLKCGIRTFWRLYKHDAQVDWNGRNGW